MSKAIENLKSVDRSLVNQFTDMFGNASDIELYPPSPSEAKPKMTKLARTDKENDNTVKGNKLVPDEGVSKLNREPGPKRRTSRFPLSNLYDQQRPCRNSSSMKEEDDSDTSFLFSNKESCS